MTSGADALTQIPQGVELPMGPSTMSVIESLWHSFPLSYDWNPQRIALRDQRRMYRLQRFGGFAVLRCPAADGASSISLLWGRGGREDLFAAMTGRAILRADRDTADHAVSIGAEWGVTTFPARNFDEYLYDLTEQTELLGKQFGRRRTYLRALERSAGSIEFAQLDLNSAEDVRAVLKVQANWESRHDREASVSDERKSLDSLLDGGAAMATTQASGLRIEGELVGFAVYDLLTESVATAHFVKAPSGSAEVAGTWQALFISAHRAGATLVNGGYDGGLQGLRSAKSGLRPHEMREAFFVLMS